MNLICRQAAGYEETHLNRKGNEGSVFWAFCFCLGYCIFVLMGKYFTTEDAGKYLGVTPSRIRQFILENRIKSEKIGRDHLIKESELESFVKKGKKKRGRPKGNTI